MSAAELLALARGKGAMIATAESCTGGMVAATITEVPGSSEIFDRGFVTYSNAAKVEMLDVGTETLAAHGAVSEPAAAEMAAGALARSAATLAVSITGIAGPGGSGTKPEGRVCFGLARQGAAILTETRDFGAIGRDQVRRRSADHALAMLIEALHSL